MNGLVEREKHLWVVGLDPFNAELMRQTPGAENVVIHELVPYKDIRSGGNYPAEALLAKCEHILASSGLPVDGITSYWDFPVSTILPILQKKYNVSGASLESVLKCEDKYWSRVEQEKVIPEHTPKFVGFNPHQEGLKIEDLGLSVPFWIKPRKSVSSYLAFRIDTQEHFDQALEVIREEIGALNKPFQSILDRADLPPEIDNLHPDTCMAEESIFASAQCTQEGYVHNGEVYIYGTVDSIHTPGGKSSFSHYLYPSRLPQDVQDQMTEISKRFIEHIGYDNAAFNIEYFWDEETGRISLLEINTRISKSHSPLFDMVDGSSHHKVMMDLALGNKPEMPLGQGEFPYAAKFMLRHFGGDGYVLRGPSARTVEKIKRTIAPELDFHPHVRATKKKPISQQLEESPDAAQDSYSFELGVIHLGGDSPEHLEDKYAQVVDSLDYWIGGPVRAPFERVSGPAPQGIFDETAKADNGQAPGTTKPSGNGPAPGS